MNRFSGDDGGLPSGVCNHSHQPAFNLTMKSAAFAFATLITLGGTLRCEEIKIDFDHAKELFQKRESGGTLTAEEQKYLEEAKRQHDAQSKPAATDAKTDSDGFDWQKARAIHQRAQQGETLSAEEQKYLDEAKQRMQSGKGPAQRGGDGFDWQRAKALYDRKQKGESLSAEDAAFLEEAMKRRGQRGDSGSRPREQASPRDFKVSAAAKDLVPLTEMTADYHGLDGGLYGAGKSDVPAEQQKLADKALAAIKPLGADGKAANDGKIVLMSIGMSNTTMEFSTFMREHGGDERKAAEVVIVDAAQGGKAAAQWASEDAPPWEVAAERLKAAGVTPQQVQVLWIKQANIRPQAGTEAEIKHLQADMEKIVTLAKVKYPNVCLAFLSSRIYAGYAQTELNPEPYAFEGAFAMRGLIQKQMKGDAALAEGKAPVLLWGPYLWAAGPTARKTDGLIWKPEDFGGDGTHPSASGAQKVAKLLIDFFTTDANAKPWFVKKGSAK